jgi:hypothetical protein
MILRTGDFGRMLYIRQNAKPLSSIEINNKTVARSCHNEAICRVCEAFEIPHNVPKVEEPSGRLSGGQRKALIVMSKRNLPREPDDKYTT